jgi:hypothetical protein
MVVRRRGDGASPAEEQEVHGDGGAPASGGSDPTRRSAAHRAADAADSLAFNEAGDLRACSTPATADGRSSSRPASIASDGSSHGGQLVAGDEMYVLAQGKAAEDLNMIDEALVHPKLEGDVLYPDIVGI